jgi:hypothetical protein
MEIELSIIELILGASLVVKLVMLLIILKMSFGQAKTYLSYTETLQKNMISHKAPWQFLIQE